MARLALSLLTGALLLGACSPTGQHDAVARSVLPGAEPVLSGPAYALRPPGPGRSTVHAGGRAHEVRRADPEWWTHDGRVLAGLRPGLALVDPATGERRRERELDALQVGVTPDAVTVIGYPPRRIDVLAPDLSRLRRITVPDSAMVTDQRGVAASPAVAGPAFTFGAVTWTRWVLDSEDEEDTDHGLLRIEGDEVRDVARNGPVESLDASTDGAALLAVLQTGGLPACTDCDAERRVGELDPRTGELVADYGMPPGYTEAWRVDDLDKVGDRVAARFLVRSAGDRGPGWQTWVYDGRWNRLLEVGSTRTWWQGAGRVVQVPVPDLDSLRDDLPPASRPYRLEWRAGSTTTVLLTPSAGTCLGLYGETYCPTAVVPGSLLPPVRR